LQIKECDDAQSGHAVVTRRRKADMVVCCRHHSRHSDRARAGTSAISRTSLSNWPGTNAIVSALPEASGRGSNEMKRFNQEKVAIDLFLECSPSPRQHLKICSDRVLDNTVQGSKGIVPVAKMSGLALPY
jgi:hypothetical protein